MPQWLENIIDTHLNSDTLLLFRFTMKTAFNFVQCWLVGAVLLISPAATQAQFIFTTNNGAIMITGYTGPGGAVSIPGVINDLPVTDIDAWSFYSAGVTSVIIPDTVTNIEDGAFFDCESLTNVTIGNSVTSIGDWAFAFCPNLNSVNFRGEAPGLGGDDVFYGNLATVYYLSEATNWTATFDGHPAVLWNPPVPFDYTINTDDDTVTIAGYTGLDGEVTIPSMINFLPVASIGSYAFYNYSGLTSVTVPDSVISIGDGAFGNCSALTNITVAANNLAYSSAGGVLFDVIQAMLIQFPAGLGGSYSIPAGVTNIGDSAFANCSGLTNVSLPNSVTGIASGAFYECDSLTSVTFGSNVTSIGDGAFAWCSDLADVTIPSGVTNIGSVAFEWCSGLASVAIPNSVTSIGYEAFYACSSLTNVTIPDSVANIGYEAFAGCTDLTSATIPNSVTNIGESTFAWCSGLTNITVGCPNIVSWAFNGLPLTSVTLLNSVTSIGDHAFDSCVGLTSVTIPNSVTYIGNWAFISCSSLTNLTIPNSVTNIGSFAFYACSGLTNVTIPNSVTSISYEAFANCSGLASLFIGSGLTSIGGSAFGSCPLSRITIACPNLGNWFSGLPFTSVTLLNSVTNIGDYAFNACFGLTNITMGNGIISIGSWAFADCSGLTSFTIPGSVTSIGYLSFIGCNALKGVNFSGNAPSVDSFIPSFTGSSIVYYLPGTTGWSTAFGGAPTALWLPQVQTDGNGFGVQTNQFGFNIAWASGQTVVVEACTNLTNPVWQPVATNALTTSLAYFSDPQWTNYPTRFYRFSSP